MPNLDIPGAGVISFPDDMPKEQIRDIVEKQIMPKVQSRVKLSGGGGNVPNDFHANVPAPTASGRGNPMLAALGLSQIGPVVASGMQPGVGRAFVEQVNAQNLALGKMIPAAWPMSSIGKKIVRSLIAAQAMPGVGTAVGQASVDQPGGQRREDITQAGLGVVQGLAAPRVGEMTGELAGRGLSALGALLPKAPAPIPVRQGPYPGQPGYIEAINKTLPKRTQGPVKPVGKLPVSETAPVALGALAVVDQTNPHLADAARSVVDRILAGDLDDAQRVLNNAVIGGDATNESPEAKAAIGEVSRKLQGMIDEARKPVTPKVKTPSQSAPVAPSPFDKGKVMPNQIAMPKPDELRAEVSSLPTDELTKRYAGTQAVAKMLLQQGRLDEASVLITRGQFMREELEKRTSSSKAVPAPPGADTPSVPLKQTEPTAPLSFQPAVRRGDKIYPGVDHGKITAVLLKQDVEAKAAGQPPLPRPERGFVGSDGKFYTTLEAARAKMEQPGAIAPQPKEENVQASQQARPEEAQKPSAPQSNVQKEVPGNVGETVRGAQPGNVQSAAGGVGQPAKSGLPSNPNRGKTTSESGFILFPSGRASIGKDLGIKSGTKVNGEQLYNRMRNVLGEGSGEFKYWADAGLKGFLASPKTVEEVEKWMNEKGTKVVVMKSGKGAQGKKNSADLAVDNMMQKQHELETLISGGYNHNDDGTIRVSGETREYMQRHPNKAIPIQRKLNEYNEAVAELKRNEAMGIQRSKVERSHWSAFGPKSEQDMREYVELAVVKPGQEDLQHEFVKKYGSDWSGKDLSTEDAARWKVSPNKFPSSHHYPPNTVCFVRAYMETDAKTGEKTFHVIEVQSDWAQRLREAKENRDTAIKNYTEGVGDISNPERAAWLKDRLAKVEADYQQEIKSANDPLLAHYERLALKAAIEHARAEGATRIAVSDAETAMMTEGHDRASTQLSKKGTVEEYKQLLKDWDTSKGDLLSPDEDGKIRINPISDRVVPELRKQGWKIEREEGMNMHYDQTLPKILSELTGERGERVGFGAHKMAVETMARAEARETGDDAGAIAQIMAMNGERNVNVPRKNLVFRESNGTPKTTVTARSFPLTNTRKEFSMFGSDKAVKVTPNFNKETGAVQVPKAVVDALADFYDRTKQVGADLKSFFDDMSGEGGRALVNTLRGKELPRTAAADKDVANKLYTYAQANAVSDVLAHTDPTEVLGSHWNDPVFDRKLGGVLVEYNLRQTGNTSIGKPWSPFKDEAQYQAAVKDPEILAAIRRHAEIVLAPAEARHTALGGKKITLPAPEAFVNLKYVPKEEGGMKAASGGLLKATLQRKTRFGQSRVGTGDEYEVSYRKLAERMVKGNYTEDLRQKLNDAYVAKGLGVYVKPGDVIPKGTQEVPLRVQRAIIVPEGEGAPTMVNQNKSLYIKKELMPEYLQAMQADIKSGHGGLRKVAEVLTKLQVSLGVDAVQHTVNIASAVNGAVRTSIGKNLIGVKELDTISQITKNVASVIQDSPEVQHLLGEMARDYGIARETKSYEGLLGGKSLGGSVIQTVDRAGRVTLFQIAKQLADAGMIKNDPVLIREFVNKQLGQYNARLASSFNQFAKAAFAPFLVAGKTFNRLAVTRLLMSPQVKAANLQAWALMRARQALYVASAVAIVPAVVNYMSTGSVYGGPDTRFGEVDLGEMGRFDMAKWTVLRRGARITGLQTLAEQQIMPRLRGEQPAALGQTARQMFSDVGRGLLAPYAGPPINALATLTTGKSALGYEAKQPGEKYPYFAAAGRQLNPLIGSTMEGVDQGKGLLAGAGKRLEQMAGSRTSNDLTVIRQLARQFNYKQGKASETDFAPSEYVPLLNAVRDGRVDEAKKLTEALVAEKGEKVVEQYFKNLPNKRFTGNKEREDEFFKSLTPHQQDVYAKAKAQNEATAKAFFEQVLGKPVPTKEPKNGFGRLSLGHF